MKFLRLLALSAVLSLGAVAPAPAQVSGGVVFIPPVTANHCVAWNSPNVLKDAGAACGTGGTGTVTSVGTGAGLTGGPISTSGTISTTEVIRAVTTTSDTILSSDAAKLVTYSNASAIAVTLPQATGSFAGGFSFSVQNLGAGLVTITPTTSTINGAASLAVPKGTGCDVVSDGTNWQISACTALNAVITGAQTFTGQQSNAITTLAIATTTFTPDGSNNNYLVNLTSACASGACTFANPSATPVAGTAGVIEFTQPASGGPASIGTGNWGSQYIYAGGTSTITFSTGANAKDFLSYFVLDSTHILLTTAALNATH